MQLNNAVHSPGPNFQMLTAKVVDQQKVSIIWDSGSIDPRRPSQQLPTGLFVIVGKKRLFIDIEELLDEASRNSSN